MKHPNTLSRPLLTGKLTFSSESMNPSIEGHWHFEAQRKLPSQTFTLIRSSSSSNGNTLDGEYSGHFFHEYKDPESKEVKTSEIKESNVKIEFKPKEGRDKVLSVKGKGINQYGIFELQGEANQELVNGKVLYNIRMYKTYLAREKRHKSND